MAAIFNTLEQVDKQDRQAILCALLSVMKEDFAFPDVILAAKRRLRFLVGTAAEEEDAVVSESSSEAEACASDRRV